MSYDYRINEVNPSKAFAKRAILYLCILVVTISLALIVLFILFERYLSLIVPAAFILLAGTVIGVMGRKVATYRYSFKERVLEVVGGGKTIAFELSNVNLIKNAEKSDFFEKGSIILSFIENKIVLKSGLNEDSKSIVSWVVEYEGKRYILALDDYSIALIGGSKDGV